MWQKPPQLVKEKELPSTQVTFSNLTANFVKKIKMPTKRSTGLKPTGQLSAVLYILANNFTSRYMKAGAYHPKRGKKTLHDLIDLSGVNEIDVELHVVQTNLPAVLKNRFNPKTTKNRSVS